MAAVSLQKAYGSRTKCSQYGGVLFSLFSLPAYGPYLFIAVGIPAITIADRPRRQSPGFFKSTHRAIASVFP